MGFSACTLWITYFPGWRDIRMFSQFCMISFKIHKDRPDGREDVQFLSIFSHELETVSHLTAGLAQSISTSPHVYETKSPWLSDYCFPYGVGDFRTAFLFQ